MKRLLLFALILGLFSCSATRKVSTFTEAKIVDKTEADVVQKREKDSTTNIAQGFSTLTTQSGNREVVIETFDTDKPVDPATGLPPLKERRTYRAREEATQQTQAATNSETNVHEFDSLADKSKYNTLLQGNASETVKTKKSVPWWVWAIIAAAGVLLIPKIKKLF